MWTRLESCFTPNALGGSTDSAWDSHRGMVSGLDLCGGSGTVPAEKAVLTKAALQQWGVEVCWGGGETRGLLYQCRDSKKGLEPSWSRGGRRRRSYSSNAVKSQEEMDWH